MVQWLPIPKIINQKFPNQLILLYRGFAELINNNQDVIEGKGLVQISWYPFPRISVKFTYHGDDRLDFKGVELKLTELSPQSRMKVHFSGSTHYVTGKNELFGGLVESFKKGSNNNLSFLVFYISNFWWFNISNEWDFEIDKKGNKIEISRENWLDFEGQFIFDYDNWHIVMATLDNGGLLQENLDAQGGYGITHICKIERLDAKPFNLDEGYEIIDAFIYYLSFVRGIWVAPFLVSGFDAQGNQILEEWQTPKIKADSWQSVRYSWTTNDCTEIVSAFPVFMKKWQDTTWKKVIQNAIQWYIESSETRNNCNTSIILIQAALEKLAWTYLKTNECVTSHGFGGLKASGQIRLLLKFLNISVTPMDNNYPELEAKAKELNWIDSIQAITEVRNAIVHPPAKTNKSRLSAIAMREAFHISRYYLLNCLLKLFEYPYI